MTDGGDCGSGIERRRFVRRGARLRLSNASVRKNADKIDRALRGGKGNMPLAVAVTMRHADGNAARVETAVARRDHPLAFAQILCAHDKVEARALRLERRCVELGRMRGLAREH